MTEEEKKKQGQSDTSKSADTSSASGSGTAASKTDNSSTTAGGGDNGTSVSTSTGSTGVSSTNAEKQSPASGKTQSGTSDANNDVRQRNNDALEKEAARLEEYSKSPVSIDTSGQTKPWDEFLNNKAAQRLVRTPEQIARDEKRERTARRLAALSDGLVALSNVTGAMFGATPVKQASTMSAAHKKNVQEAAERHRLNFRQYEVARNNAMKLQQKQDEDNAKRYDDEVAARRKAGEKAASIRQGLGKQARTQDNADRTYQLAKDRAEQAKNNADRNYKLSRQRLALAQSKESRLSGGNGGGGGTSKEDDAAAYKYWMSLTDEQKKKWRDWNKRGKTQTDINGNPTYVKDDKTFINHVWKERKAWLKTHQQGGKQKKSVQGFSGSKPQTTTTTTNKKKTIAGFGTK